MLPGYRMKWTRCVVELSEAEEVPLQQLSINHRHRDTRTRAAGVLMLGRGLKPRTIAAQLDVSGQTVYNWFHAWRDSGVFGLMGGHNGGRAPALSDGMVATALEVARAEPLTVAQIAQRVQDVHGEPLPCRIETFGEALKRAGFTFKRNRYTLKKAQRRGIRDEAGQVIFYADARQASGSRTRWPVPPVLSRRGGLLRITARSAQLVTTRLALLPDIRTRCLLQTIRD